MEIAFARWKLREWRPGDEPAIIKYANNYKIWRNLDDIFPHPYTLEDARHWIKHCSESQDIQFAITDEREAIGGIGLELQPDIHRLSARVGYWLGEPFWGRGISSAALGALVRYAFNSTSLVRIYTIVFEWNPASCRVLEKNGFQREAVMRRSVLKDGKLIDCFLYALLKPD